MKKSIQQTVLTILTWRHFFLMRDTWLTLQMAHPPFRICPIAEAAVTPVTTATCLHSSDYRLISEAS
jgi:hypothetical protein